MSHEHTDLSFLIEKALTQPDSFDELEEVGTVIKVSDGICYVYGLKSVTFNEVIHLEGGNKGMVIDIDEEVVSAVLFHGNIPVVEQEKAKSSGKIFQTKVGSSLIGRIVNIFGDPLDGKGEVEAEAYMPIERPAPGIVDRVSIHEPLETGITVIDALIPIGKGQRELIIGDRSTGKTSLLMDIILNQKGKSVICIYVAIGQKRSDTARLLDFLERSGCMDYTFIVNADAQDSTLHQYLAPYVGCTMGEFFMDAGRNVLIMYDDLTNHAASYRELSLLIKRPPGREAYPGDIFYIHSRLLERAGKMNDSRGGGSMTALPVAQTLGNDIAAFIPTNLISITDGQLFLNSNLFNSNVRPAVDIGLSVSRVAGAAQRRAIKKVMGSLKLELARYDELITFAQFGCELDRASREAIDRGERAVALLKQPLHETYPFVYQVLFLFLLRERYLDQIKIEDIRRFVISYASIIEHMHPRLYEVIHTSGDITDEQCVELRDVANKCFQAFPQDEKYEK